MATPTPALNGRSSAQHFMEEHDQLVSENEALKAELANKMHDNGVLLSEVNMLREELARADKDKTLLHGFFAGLKAKNEMVETAFKMLDQAFREAAKLGLENFRQVHQPEEPAKEAPIEEPSKVVLSTTIPEIEEKLRASLNNQHIGQLLKMAPPTFQ